MIILPTRPADMFLEELQNVFVAASYRYIALLCLSVVTVNKADEHSEDIGMVLLESLKKCKAISVDLTSARDVVVSFWNIETTKISS